MNIQEIVRETDRRGTRVFPLRTLRAETLVLVVSCIPLDVLESHKPELVTALQRLGWQ